MNRLPPAMASAEEAHVKLRQPLEILHSTLKCVICLEDYKDPVLTRCEHLFCWECISRILKDRRNPRCPLCKEPVSRRSAVKVEHISQLIARFIQLRDSIPKDTGFEIESFLGVPAGAREAPTNSPVAINITKRDSFNTKITPKAAVIEEVSTMSPIPLNTLAMPVEVPAIDTAPEKSISSPPKSNKFGRCYKRKSSKLNKSAEAEEGLSSCGDSVHSESKDNSRMYLPSELGENILSSDTSVASDAPANSDLTSTFDKAVAASHELTTDSENVAGGSVSTNSVKTLEEESHFPFNYPARKVKDSVTFFEKLLKKSSAAGRPALSGEGKVSHDKKIFTCNIQPEGKEGSEKCGDKEGVDPYVFVSSQHTPHRVKYRKDGVKDLGKVGQRCTRKKAVKRKQSKEEICKEEVRKQNKGEMRKDLCSVVDGVSLLEMGSQNFIESCPVEVNDEFDKLVVESHKSALQSHIISGSFHGAPDDKDNSEDLSLACLFRTPNSEEPVTILPGEDEESHGVGKDKKKRYRRGKEHRKSVDVNSSLDHVKSNPRKTKSLQPYVSSEPLSQQLKAILQQFDEVSSHELPVEEKETSLKSDTNKNILDLDLSTEQVDSKVVRKSSNSTKRVSFADIDSKVQTPADKDCHSTGKLPFVDQSVTNSEQNVGTVLTDNSKSNSVSSLNNICQTEIIAEMPVTPQGKRFPGRSRSVANITMNMKPTLTFDLISEAGSSVSSPGEPLLGFAASPTSEQLLEQWTVHAASNMDSEASPGLKRKREDIDEISNIAANEIREDSSSVITAVCAERVEIMASDGIVCNSVETLQVHNRESSFASVAAEENSNSLGEFMNMHVAKKMKHCGSSHILGSRPQGSRFDSSSSNTLQKNCDQETQTAVDTVDVGTEVEIHLTSKRPPKTRTYVEASVQTDTFEHTVEKYTMSEVGVQTSPVSVEKSTCFELQSCEERETTESVPGSCDETVESTAYLAQNFKELGSALCVQSDALTESSEIVELSSLEDVDSEINVIDSSIQPEMKTKVSHTSNNVTEKMDLLPDNAINNMVTSGTLTFEKKKFQPEHGKPTLAHRVVESPDQSPKTVDINSSKTKGKGLLSLSANRTSRKLSFSPNYVPTLSKEAFPMVMGTDSSDSDVEFTPVRHFKSTKKSRRLSLSSESDAEQKGKTSANICRSGVSGDAQVSTSQNSGSVLAVSEVIDVGSSQMMVNNIPQPASMQFSKPSSLSKVEKPSSVNPNALITPSLQALLQTAVSQENTMEILEGGGVCELTTQRSVSSSEPIDTQQLQKIDLAISAANAKLVSPENSRQHGKAGQSEDSDMAIIEDHEMMYDDIIEPTPQKESSFVTHRISKTKNDASFTSKSLNFTEIPSSQATNPVSEVEDKSVGCMVDNHLEAAAAQKVSVRGRNQPPAGGQRTPLQVVTNALPPVPTSVASAPREQKKPACIACSMLSAQSKFLVQKFVEFFGLSYSMTYQPGVTHLLVPRTDESIQSVKYVFAVAEKKWVLYEDWVRDSLKARAMLPEEDYEVSEPVSGGPKRSRLSKQPLFSNYVMCFVPPLEAITKEQIEEVSRLCGAEVVAEPAQLFCRPGCTALLLANEKLDDLALELFREYKIPPVSYYYVIDCISAYKLFDPYVYVITKKMDELVFRQFGYNSSHHS